MNDPHELRRRLADHTGSTRPYRHSLVRSFFYTEGVREFAQHAGGGAYWLLDILGTEPKIREHVMGKGFAIVVLNVVGSQALLTVANDLDDRNGFEDVVFRRQIEFTDCPVGEWKFYLEPTRIGAVTGVMCLLPQEH